MANWLMFTNLKGIYTHPPFSIPIEGYGAVCKIEWDAVEPSGSTLIIQTRFGYDGVQWSEWRVCRNGSKIPDMDESLPLSHVLIEIRVIMQSDSYSTVPQLLSVRLEFEPVIIFNNNGIKDCKPEIWITKVENGDLSIILSPNETEFKLSNLVDGETVYIDSENKDIETSLAATYRYKDFNGNFLSFPVGKSLIKIKGKADIKFRYQLKLLQ